MLQHYFKIMFRNLWRSKLYSFINMAGLALGLTCCMLIVLYNMDETSFDKFHKNISQLHRVVATMKDDKETRNLGITNSPAGPAFKEEVPGIKAFVRVQGDYNIIKKGNEVFGQPTTRVDTNFFSVFSFPLIAGDASTVFKGPNAVVITDEMAIKYFGTTDVMGKALQVKTGDLFEQKLVTGIAKKAPQNSSINFDVLLPFKDDSNEWLGFYLSTYLLLDENVSAATVAARFDNVFLERAKGELKEAKEKFNFKGSVHFGLQPFSDVHLDSMYGQEAVNKSSKPIYSYILSGIAIFILLIACINFINLQLAHSIQRFKEIGVRKVMGGDRLQLIKQFLGESFLLSFFSFLIAIGLVLLILPVFNGLANKQLSFSMLLSTRLMVAYLGLFFITGLVAGFYPALVLSGFNPLQTIHNRHRFTSKNYLTKGLVIFQFTLATFLIISTILVYKQFNFLTHKNLGYNDRNIVLLDAGRGVAQQDFDLIKSELSASPYIQLVSGSDGHGNITVGKADGKEIDFAYKRIDGDYLKTLQISLVKGRNLLEGFPGDSTRSVVVNESFVKSAGWDNPLGKQVDFFWDNRKVTVVGVVKDYHFQSLQNKIMPQLFVADPGYRIGQIVVKINPANVAAALNFIAATFKKVFPFQPYSYKFMDEQNRLNYSSESKWKQIITFAAFLSIFISCIGLFGLSILSTEKRTKEIGIRKVLGASVQSVVALLSSNFIKLVFIAFLIAIPFAWYANNKWLQNFPYRTSFSWLVFVAAGASMLLLAIATISFQSAKAALTNPVKSLRSE